MSLQSFNGMIAKGAVAAGVIGAAMSSAMAQQEQTPVTAAAVEGAATEVVTQPAPVRVGDPYLENVCPVSGEALEESEMGGPVTKIYDGREIRFCCKGCIKDFDADQATYLSKADEIIIARQMAYYPTTKCVVSDEVMGGDEMGEPVDFVYNNRLVRFCCKGCKGDFLEDPQAYLSKLDQAVIAQQRADYPLTKCPVSGETLDDSSPMGAPVEKVYGNRLVRFCCKGCIKKFEANPTAYIAAIDKGWGRTVEVVAEADEHEAHHEAAMPGHDMKDMPKSGGMPGHSNHEHH